jgi:hypothetical protein
MERTASYFIVIIRRPDGYLAVAPAFPHTTAHAPSACRLRPAQAAAQDRDPPSLRPERPPAARPCHPDTDTAARPLVPTEPGGTGMSLWLRPLASAVGVHKPRGARVARISRTRAARPRREQGGILASSWRESAGASRHSPPNRQPAVVGLAAPPYGLPSADPTAPAPTARLRRPVGPASLRSSGSRWRSAHADNRPRSAFPLDLLPSRGKRAANHVLFSTSSRRSSSVSAPLEAGW